MRYSRTQLALKYANRSGRLRVGVMLLLAGTMLTPWFVPTLLADLRLAWYGVTAQATVRNKIIASTSQEPIVLACLFALGGGNRKQHYVNYEFKVHGKAYTRTEIVSPAIWNAAQIGERVEVVYLPSDPNVCRASDPIWRPSAPSNLDFWVEFLEFCAGVFDGEVPVDAALFGVGFLGPGFDF